MTLTRAALVSGALVWATAGLATWAWFTLPGPWLTPGCGTRPTGWGRLMMLGGVALVGAVLVLRDPLALAAAMAVCASVPMAAATWSWRLHRRA